MSVYDPSGYRKTPFNCNVRRDESVLVTSPINEASDGSEWTSEATMMHSTQSIFFSRRSLYASLDGDVVAGEESERQQQHRRRARRAPSQLRQLADEHEHEQTADEHTGSDTPSHVFTPSEAASATDHRDPFGPPSPSAVGSPPRQHEGARQREQALSQAEQQEHESGLPSDAMDETDSRSPFHTEPITSSSPAAGSVAAPADSRVSAVSPSTSPSGSSRGGTRKGQASDGAASARGKSHAGASAISSSGAIGNRSLMGLLGGTRYEPGAYDHLIGFPGGGQPVLEESDEEHDVEARGRSPAQVNRRSLSSERGLSDDDDDDDNEPPPELTAHARDVEPESTRLMSARRWGRIRLPGAEGERLSGMSVLELARRRGMGARERALWRWVNVVDLDAFLREVYDYYTGKGIYAIALSKLLDLLSFGWVIFFSTFLLGCVDYSVLWDAHSLDEIVIGSCVSRFSGATLMVVITFAVIYLWRVFKFGIGIRKLWDMHEFFVHLLDVPENDIQTIPWHVLVDRLSSLRAAHPSALSGFRSTLDVSNSGPAVMPRLDAHDIASRIMREENYLIALFNKDTLDLSVPRPSFVAPWLARWLGLAPEPGTLTRTLEWNLTFCLTGFLFGPDGQVRRAFVTDKQRPQLIKALRTRLLVMGHLNFLFAPFIILYLVMYSFFRYFEEYHKNPSSIGVRQFTNFARWKFREFNELPHLFDQRLDRAHPLAERYVNQFPKEKTALVSRFVALIAGSFAAVLILFSLVDPEAFLHFEVTPGRTVLFYIGVFGGILAIARGMMPGDHQISDPEEIMKSLVEQTHYMPIEWRGNLHSAEVHAEFSKLFQLKLYVFFKELFSVIATPFVLWYSLPACAPAIIDFFREFTVHVDGIGYVCSFAVFDFKRHGDYRFGAPSQAADERWQSREGKMEKSFLNFKAANPDWVPHDQAQSLFLSRLTEDSSAPPPSGASRGAGAAAQGPGQPAQRRGGAQPTATSTAGLGSGGNPRMRLAPPPSATDEPGGPSMGGGARVMSASRRAERARMYERALNRSMLLASSYGASPLSLYHHHGPPSGASSGSAPGVPASSGGGGSGSPEQQQQQQQGSTSRKRMHTMPPGSMLAARTLNLVDEEEQSMLDGDEDPYIVGGGGRGAKASGNVPPPPLRRPQSQHQQQQGGGARQAVVSGEEQQQQHESGEREHGERVGTGLRSAWSDMSRGW